MENNFIVEKKKMHKRQCHVILCSNGKIFDIHYFVINTTTDNVFGVDNLIKVKSDKTHIFDSAGRHIFCMECREDLVVSTVNVFIEKVFFIAVDNCYYVTKMPNHFGYGVLK